MFTRHFINAVSRCMFRLVTIHFQGVPGSTQVIWNCLLYIICLCRSSAGRWR